MRRKKRQTNCRLSVEALKLVARTAKASGMTKTQVIEVCIARHAETVPGLADDARRALLQLFGTPGQQAA